MTNPAPAPRPHGVAAAEHLSPSFPARAPWGTASKLRAWQEEAIGEYLEHGPRDWLVAATPGAGKTTFALRLAAELRSRGEIDRITVVAPTEHLKKQWADAAARIGIRLDPDFRNSQGSYARHFHGVAVTYAQVAARPILHRRITDSGLSLVILDEVHHGGDALSWGEAVREAFGPARRRLSLTGTPFRSDTAPIPFVNYLPDHEGTLVSQTDFSYGYGRALQDGVVRPVLFHNYAGRMRWRTRSGDEMEARLGEEDTKDVTSQAWRTALDPSGDWMRAVLRSADRRLSEVRHTVEDAGGLVIATDQTAARAYGQMLTEITGEQTTIVISDDKDASGRIEDFAKSQRRWIVAVRMVSEGVDVPRLMVGVYATSASTPLFFAQAIGRFVRARRRGETASIFLPTVPVLTGLASTMEKERDHALAKRGDEGLLDDHLMEAAERADADSSQDGELELGEYAALASEAQFDRVMFDGAEFGIEAEVGSAEEEDFIGIPGILEPEQIRELLQHRQQRQQRRVQDRRRSQPESAPEEPVALFRTVREQRSLLNSLVGARAKHTGQPHGLVHAEVRRICGGPEVSKASVTQLEARIQLLRSWMGAKT